MFIEEVYQRAVADNDKNLRFWEDYLNSLKSLDFSVYAKKLKVPILVPVGSRLFYRGDLKHTNEVTVALGADYFVKCSLNQADILRQHRIKGAESKVEIYKKEKEYLENHLSFTKQNVYDKEGQEIIEQFTEMEDIAWRKQHRENVRKYKQSEAKTERQSTDEITDSELLERLEELELQEELENEMLNDNNEIVGMREETTLVDNKLSIIELSKNVNHEQPSETSTVGKKNDTKIVKQPKNNHKATNNGPEESSKLDLLQTVLDKQNELENKLHELKYREREKSKTEQDLISKLDELEQLDELEDEIDRLDDILDTENVDSEHDNCSISSDQSESKKLKKSIHFQVNDDSETIEITYTHSSTEPSCDQYDPKNGITKPSDIYEAFAHLFVTKQTSILKKSKYEAGEKEIKKIKFTDNLNSTESSEKEEIPINREIVICDVVENKEQTLKKIEMGARPTSLFKQRRLQNKT